MSIFTSQPKRTHVDIRAMMGGDYPDCVKIDRASHPEGEGKPLAYFERQNRDKSTIGIVALAGGVVVAGYAIYRYDPTSIEILRLAVMPAWRCRGIGKTLVQRIVNSMEDAPRQLVEMTVDESTIEHNGPFLFSCGFTCHGYLKDEGNRSTRDIAFYRLRSTAPVQGASGCCGI